MALARELAGRATLSRDELDDLGRTELCGPEDEWADTDWVRMTEPLLDVRVYWRGRLGEGWHGLVERVETGVGEAVVRFHGPGLRLLREMRGDAQREAA